MFVCVLERREFSGEVLVEALYVEEVEAAEGFESVRIARFVVF